MSYEANPFVFDLLVRNAQINFCDQVGRSVFLLNKAAYSEETELTFHVTTKFQGNSSLKEHNQGYFDAFLGDSVQQIKVKADPLDVFQEVLQRIDLVKIDVEGAEYSVLRGMEKLLKGGVVQSVVFEYNKNMLGEESGLLIELLLDYEANHDYRFYVIKPDGETVLTTLPHIWEHEYLDCVLMKKVQGTQ